MPQPPDVFRPAITNSNQKGQSLENPSRRLLIQSALALPGLKLLSAHPSVQNTPVTDHPQQVDAGIPNTELSAEQLLQTYLEDIAELQANALEVTSHQTYFDLFHISLDAQQEDLERFFRFYLAAERKYKVPWEYLWIMHEHESTASRHPNPGKNGYIGAMQRSRVSYPDTKAIQAATGWEFLSKAPQRYTPPQYPTYDFQEIFFAAWKLRRDANKILQNNDITDLQALEEAQFSYCASENAVLRIRDLHIIRKDLLHWEILNKSS